MHVYVVCVEGREGEGEGMKRGREGGKRERERECVYVFTRNFMHRHPNVTWVRCHKTIKCLF